MFQFAQSKGVQVRIRLIEKIFEDASFINADDPLRMPMTYAEVGSFLMIRKWNNDLLCAVETIAVGYPGGGRGAEPDPSGVACVRRD